MIKKINISGLELGLDNGLEIIRMGGPYVCDVWLEDKLIIRQCISHNFILDNNRRYLFFVQYHKINYYEYFTINIYQLDSEIIVQFTREFEILYLGALVNDHELEIYLAFHDKLPQLKRVVNLDDEDFIEID